MTTARQATEQRRSNSCLIYTSINYMLTPQVWPKMLKRTSFIFYFFTILEQLRKTSMHSISRIQCCEFLIISDFRTEREIWLSSHCSAHKTPTFFFIAIPPASLITVKSLWGCSLNLSSVALWKPPKWTNSVCKKPLPYLSRLLCRLCLVGPFVLIQSIRGQSSAVILLHCPKVPLVSKSHRPCPR